MKRRTGSVRLWAAAFWLLVWEGASLALAATTGGRMLLLASPVQALGRLLALAGTAAFWQAVAFSSLRILGGFLLACALAAVLAPLAARFQWVRDLLSPLVAVVKAVPVVSFIILALIDLLRQRHGCAGQAADAARRRCHNAAAHIKYIYQQVHTVGDTQLCQHKVDKVPQQMLRSLKVPKAGGTAKNTDGKKQNQQPVADGLHPAVDGHNGLPDGAALEGLGRFRQQ